MGLKIATCEFCKAIVNSGNYDWTLSEITQGIEHVRKGTLDPVDIPAGPWGHTIDLPWYEEEAREWNREMAVASLKKIREYGIAE